MATSVQLIVIIEPDGHSTDDCGRIGNIDQTPSGATSTLPVATAHCDPHGPRTAPAKGVSPGRAAQARQSASAQDASTPALARKSRQLSSRGRGDAAVTRRTDRKSAYALAKAWPTLRRSGLREYALSQRADQRPQQKVGEISGLDPSRPTTEPTPGPCAWAETSPPPPSTGPDPARARPPRRGRQTVKSFTEIHRTCGHPPPPAPMFPRRSSKPPQRRRDLRDPPTADIAVQTHRHSARLDRDRRNRSWAPGAGHLQRGERRLRLRLDHHRLRR